MYASSNMGLWRSSGQPRRKRGGNSTPRPSLLPATITRCGGHHSCTLWCPAPAAYMVRYMHGSTGLQAYACTRCYQRLRRVMANGGYTPSAKQAKAHKAAARQQARQQAGSTATQPAPPPTPTAISATGRAAGQQPPRQRKPYPTSVVVVASATASGSKCHTGCMCGLPAGSHGKAKQHLPSPAAHAVVLPPAWPGMGSGTGRTMPTPRGKQPRS